MLKKFIALAVTAALLLSLAGCAGGNTVKLPELTPETKETAEGKTEIVHTAPNGGKFEDTLLGLMGFMEEGKAVARSSENGTVEQALANEDSSLVQTSYKEIGAVNGYRYTFTYKGSTVQAEFYEFDPANLDAKGKEVVDSVTLTGSFTLLGKEIKAVMHPSGKYMMIYLDSKAEGKKPVAENLAQKEWASQLFGEF